MSFFNEKLVKALFSGEYICNECGEEMEFEDERDGVLVCSHCGHSVDLDDYGCEDYEDYEILYPTREEVLGIEEDKKFFDGKSLSEIESDMVDLEY